MPSFLIRGLARYFAASAMESRARSQSSYTPSPDSLSDDSKKHSSVDLTSWQSQMRWLIPFVQATGNQVVIENPKSHEQIIIDKNTKELPELSLEWMQKYDKQELLEWITKERVREQQEEEERIKKLDARRIEEVRGRARFGNSFTLGDKDSNDLRKKNENSKNGNYLIPILCICVFILALIGLWVYNSPMFAFERYEKENMKRSTIVRKEEKNEKYKNKALEIINQDLGHTLDNYNNYHPIETKMYAVNLTYLGDSSIMNLVSAIKEADSKVYYKRHIEDEAFRTLSSFIGAEEYRSKHRNRWREASSDVRNAEHERQLLIDSLSTIVNNKGQYSNKSGWKVNHVFKSEDDDYYSGNSYYTYYFDKDFSRILLQVCGDNNQTLHMEKDFFYWSNDYVEFANRIYEEAREQARGEKYKSVSSLYK